MRVIAGDFKGKRLTAPKSDLTRPTTDIVKEGIFCKLAFDVPNSVCLDLFSGSGALGIECLSRGAEFVDFVDKSSQGFSLTKKNLKDVFDDKLSNFCVFKSDCQSFLLQAKRTYDIILLDPPYKSGLYEKCLQIIFDKNLLNDDGKIVCEHDNDFVFEKYSDKVFCTKKYGNTSVSYLKN